MPKINRIYLTSHTHTDIGYTDHQDTVFRQHLDFIDRAIELGEATADYPEEARYKWTCEVTAFVERYFQQRPAAQVDRFLELHSRGQMAVAGMQYHWTPMLSTAAMLRSLLPVRRLRADYGIDITAAMHAMSTASVGCGLTCCLPSASTLSRCPSICTAAPGPSLTSKPSGGGDPAADVCSVSTDRIISTGYSATGSAI